MVVVVVYVPIQLTYTGSAVCLPYGGVQQELNSWLDLVADGVATAMRHIWRVLVIEIKT